MLLNTQSYPTPAIIQARILKWVAFPPSRGSSQPRDWTQVSCISGRFFTIWATREAPESLMEDFKKENAWPLFSSVQSLSHVWLFATPQTAAHQVSLSITNSWSLLKFMSIKSVMPSNHLILCCPLLLPPSIFPNIRVFSSESVLHIRYQSFQWIFRTDYEDEVVGWRHQLDGHEFE